MSHCETSGAIEIEHGCIRDPNSTNLYYYVEPHTKAYIKDYQSLLEVIDERTTHIFVAMNGAKPAIGDFISGGTLIKRTEPKVNNDWSRWKDKDL